MKIRRDFVTNSSSSSFVIGKYDDDDTVTIDSVFHIICDFYKDYIEKRDALMRDKDKWGLEYIVSDDSGTGGYASFRFKNRKFTLDVSDKRDKEIRKIYGISTWDYYHTNYEWLNFETYQEYEDYWVEKIKAAGKDSMLHAPFAICDYSKPNASYLAIENGSYGISNSYTDDCDYGLLGWYVTCAESVLAGCYDASGDDHCRYCYFAEKDDEKCKAFKNQAKEGKINCSNAIAILLGKICIHSECGYISDYVVEKLSEISSFHCNHMG